MDYLICCQSCEKLYSTNSLKYSFDSGEILKVLLPRCPYCGSRDGVIMRGLMENLELAKQLINESVKVIFESSREELAELNIALKKTNQKKFRDFLEKHPKLQTIVDFGEMYPGTMNALAVIIAGVTGGAVTATISGLISAAMQYQNDYPEQTIKPPIIHQVYLSDK